MAKSNTNNSYITITAHSGCENTEPNSIASIVKGAECGANIVEVDLRFYKGVPILSHNRPKGKELPLEEALKVISTYDNLKLNIDLKEIIGLKEVYRLLEKYNLVERSFFTGVTFGKYPIVRKLVPQMNAYINCRPLITKEFPFMARHLARRVKRYGAIGLNISKVFANHIIADACKKEGIQLSVWTVTPKEFKSCRKYHPDNITTRHPSVLIGRLKSK